MPSASRSRQSSRRSPTRTRSTGSSPTSSPTLRYGEAPITISAEQRDRHFRLRVEDRGRGVAPEFVPHLFERFTRGRKSAEVGGAAGLGLSIAQSYAHAHGGELVYEQAKPRGASFELVLRQAK